MAIPKKPLRNIASPGFTTHWPILDGRPDVAALHLELRGVVDELAARHYQHAGTTMGTCLDHPGSPMLPPFPFSNMCFDAGPRRGRNGITHIRCSPSSSVVVVGAFGVWPASAHPDSYARYIALSEPLLRARKEARRSQLASIWVSEALGCAPSWHGESIHPCSVSYRGLRCL